jgi:translation elongation factor EF-Ts
MNLVCPILNEAAQKLREETHMGLKRCKYALKDANYNYKKAVEMLYNDKKNMLLVTKNE